MSVQKYIVNKESSNFTIIPNKIIQALKNQLELLGFYTYLLSLPPAWNFHKNHLKESTGIGVKKLERFLRELSEMNLITVRQVRDDGGRFSHFDLMVLNGNDFKIKDISPCVKNRTTVNGSTVKNTYKRNKLKKKNIEKKETFLGGASRQKNPPPVFDFTPSPESQGIAADLGRDVWQEKERFVDYCKAKNKKYSNPDSQFKNWLRIGQELREAPEKSKKGGNTIADFVRKTKQRMGINDFDTGRTIDAEVISTNSESDFY